MTKTEAELVIVRFALENAQNRVEFLHNCLTEPRYSYGDPASTIKELAEWEELNPRRGYCHHSVFKLDCAECRYRNEQFERIYQAKKVLNLLNS